MALLHILLALKDLLGVSKYSIIHVNHGIRKESTEEEHFVKALADSLGLEIITDHPDVIAYQKEKHVSLEMAARECRYKAFSRAKELIKADKIALAHHGDDQAEEVILRLCRGTGLEGLFGMLPRKEEIIRPLLWATKKELIEYLKAKNIAYVEDKSNEAPIFQRNRIRLEALPLLEDIFKRPVKNILTRLTAIAREEESYWKEIISNYWKTVCLQESDRSIEIDLSSFNRLHPALKRRLIRYGLAKLKGSGFAIFFNHVEAIKKLCEKGKGTGKRLKIHSINVVKERDKLIFTLDKTHPEQPQKIYFLEGFGSFVIDEFNIKITLKEATKKEFENHLRSPTLSQFRAFMDSSAIKGRMFIRGWLPGDKFMPLGMKGKFKKLQDFFVDLKIPLAKKGFVPLLCDSEKICCVLGYRLDERVKVTEETTDILEVSVDAINKNGGVDRI